MTAPEFNCLCFSERGVSDLAKMHRANETNMYPLCGTSSCNQYNSTNIFFLKILNQLAFIFKLLKIKKLDI